MLLLLDIDDQMADLFDEDGDYEGIAESIAQSTFGIETAEIVCVQDHATYVGVTLRPKITLDYVRPIIKGTLEQIRSTLWRTSLRQILH